MEKSEAMGREVSFGAAEGPREEGRAILTTGLAAGGMLGAIAASACCLLPLVLVSVGVTGAWMGNLTAFEPYRPILIAVTIALLAAGFVMAYRRPKAAACGDGGACAKPRTRTLTKTLLWIALALFLAAIGFPYAAAVIL